MEKLFDVKSDGKLPFNRSKGRYIKRNIYEIQSVCQGHRLWPQKEIDMIVRSINDGLSNNQISKDVFNGRRSMFSIVGKRHYLKDTKPELFTPNGFKSKKGSNSLSMNERILICEKRYNGVSYKDISKSLKRPSSSMKSIHTKIKKIVELGNLGKTWKFIQKQFPCNGHGDTTHHYKIGTLKDIYKYCNQYFD